METMMLAGVILNPIGLCICILIPAIAIHLARRSYGPAKQIPVVFARERNARRIAEREPTVIDKGLVGSPRANDEIRVAVSVPIPGRRHRGSKAVTLALSGKGESGRGL